MSYGYRSWASAIGVAIALVVCACSASSEPAQSGGDDGCSKDPSGASCCQSFGGTPEAADGTCPAGKGLACHRGGVGGYPDHCCFPPSVSSCGTDAAAPDAPPEASVDPCTDFGSAACCTSFGGTAAGPNDTCPAGKGLACHRGGVGSYPDHCCFPPVVSSCGVDAGADAHP